MKRFITMILAIAMVITSVVVPMDKVKAAEVNNKNSWNSMPDNEKPDKWNSVEKVKTFVNEVANFDTEIDLVSSRYVIDAKSIMGILSLDLSKPIEVEV